jgi:hypothetical protein
MTPPNLLGTLREIQYANEKYHSGLICSGVFIISTNKKFSESINIKGSSNNINLKNNISIKKETKSFNR